MTLFRSDLVAAPNRSAGSAMAVGGILLVLGMALSAMLWPEWRQNPDLSHGFLAPFVFILLVWESRRLGPQRWIRRSGLTVVSQLALSVVSIVLFALAGLFAAPVGWSHSLVLFLLAVCFACLLLAGLGLLADEHVRVLPFNWINLTAILLWVLVAPLPTGTYSRLTLALQSWVTGGVMDVLQFLGVPARQHGNVIELARTTVGVEEACSGVRSLISCIYAGFFLAAWQLNRPWRRVCLIALAPMLALLMNFIRSLALTLLANAGVNIGGTWHDATGFAILGLTTAILVFVALQLETKRESTSASAAGVLPTESARGSGAWAFLSGVGLTCALGIFFFTNSRSTIPVSTPPPSLAALLPTSATGWEVRTPDDLYRFSGVLGTTHLLQRTYLRSDGTNGTVDLTVYVAYWPAGQASVSRVASHTPDACWPGSGWTVDPSVNERRQSPSVAGLSVTPAEYRLFRTERGYQQYVWFWHVFDGHVIDYRDPYSLSALLEIALEYGFRRQGSQYFIRVSSNRPWTELAKDPLVREIMTNLKSAGL